MDHANVVASLPQSALDLHEAAGVRGHDRTGAGAHDVLDLPLEDRPGEIGLGDVVGARASAAPVRLLERNDVQTGDRREQRSWLRADLLTMQQVARVVPRYPPAQRLRGLAH